MKRIYLHLKKKIRYRQAEKRAMFCKMILKEPAPDRTALQKEAAEFLDYMKKNGFANNNEYGKEVKSY